MEQVKQNVVEITSPLSPAVKDQKPKICRLQQGEVLFIHDRFSREVIHPQSGDTVRQILPNGGRTIAYQLVGDVLEFAWSRCSRKDTFDRKRGRSIAKHRLLSQNALIRNRSFLRVSRDIRESEAITAIKTYMNSYKEKQF